MLQFLILVAAISVVGVLYRAYNQQHCPTDENLRDYFAGRLRKGSAERQRIIGHLGGCQKCRDKVDEFNGVWSNGSGQGVGNFVQGLYGMMPQLNDFLQQSGMSLPEAPVKNTEKDQETPVEESES